MLAVSILMSVLALGPAPPQEPDTPPPPADAFKPNSGWSLLGKDAWFDAKGKVLILRARVALQDGALEHLVCRKGTKEHESVLATEAPARVIHAGLLLTGASPGHPVRFDPRYEPPTGSPIAIEVEWVKDGKPLRVDARELVKDQATGSPLARNWVFAGSELFEDPRSKAMIYAADDGDLVTVANFPAAILDLPFRSSANDADRTYLARADRVPPRGTPVTVYLRPRSAQVQPKPKSAQSPPPR